MTGPIFLSAGVPDAKRGPEFAATADTVAITAAVSALVYVTLGRRVLIWGGHPGITPMVWIVARDTRVDYGKWVRLYQSRYFEDEFPEDNEQFMNVTYTADVDHDREKSLLRMREQMFTENKFAAAVFVGGMGGVLQEFDLFRHRQPSARIVPVMSAGGAALKLAERVPDVPNDLMTDLDYVGLFHRHLDISVREARFARPEDQPLDLGERYWRTRGDAH